MKNSTSKKKRKKLLLLLLLLPFRLTSCDDSCFTELDDEDEDEDEGRAIRAVTCVSKCRCAARACSSCAARARSSACCCIRRCCSSCCCDAAAAPRLPPPLAAGSPAPPRPRGTLWEAAEPAGEGPPPFIRELAGLFPETTSLSRASCSRSSAAPGAVPDATPLRAFCTSPSAALNIPSPSLALARLASAARFPGLASSAASHSERASFSLAGRSRKQPARATRRSAISVAAEEAGAALMAAS